MIGEVRRILTPYYDKRKAEMGMKYRPGLIIAQADLDEFGDYTVLPISSVSDSRRVHPLYDYQIDPTDYPNLNLTKICYVRTHKQTAIAYQSIGSMYGNLKEGYPDLYLDILEKWEAYIRQIQDNVF